MSDSLNLAITKIGDLLINKKITTDSEGKSIDDITLKIPEYQRPYKWTAKNANQLLDDIIYAKNENKEVYRVGTLILHENKNVYDIVDGQQRVTTFVLLLAALGEENVEFLSQETDNPYTRYNVVHNYRTLKRRIDSLGDESGGLCEYIKDNCELIVVITKDISEAFQFFDSQNARGKKLYPHDLLKAYHLREMKNLDDAETERVVKTWEDLKQSELAELFSEYLYRIKEWIKGNKSYELTEHNIDLFKGINAQNNFAYAQFYKGAYAYADNINQSHLPFVTGMQKLSPFQLDTPIIAGKPFFDYAKHYFDLLADIRNNDKFEGYYINDNNIIETLNNKKYSRGVGNRIARLLLDTAILLYIDRFCPEKPVEADTKMLNEFVVYAFVWAYSLRAQYQNLGWRTAQNYIMGNGNVNSFNLYKVITESDSPIGLLNTLSVKLMPLSQNHSKIEDIEYLQFFKEHKFWEEEQNEK